MRSGKVTLGGLSFDRLTEPEVTGHILDALREGRGGWVVTPNVDICRLAAARPDLHELIGRASLVVADGMPIIWAARLRGDPLPERVTGSSLIFSLTAAAAADGRSIYLLGGQPGVPEMAAEQLTSRFPRLTVTGTDAPPLDFDQTDAGLEAVRRKLAAADPAIVYVGLGFPKQERLIAWLAPSFPRVWFISCGAAIPFAAGELRRAPVWMQRSGLEWLARLAGEPRRLARRYLMGDAPFAVRLLSGAALARLRPRSGPQA
jgi:N-acetylglucosaminyldiphosphoundecaprenol N-acetyl-beta-D-mannosaminyltransferase